MTTKQDWTFAGFLYGLANIACVVIAGYAIIVTINFFSSVNNGQPKVIELPVKIESRQKMATVDVENSSINVHSIDKLTGEIDISASGQSKRALIEFQLFKVIGWGIYFSIFLLLGRVFKTVKDGEPFHENNPKYFKYMGLILISAHILFAGYDVFFAHPFFEQLSYTSGLEVTSLSIYNESYLYTGLFMVLLGLVFKEGSRLHEEQQLTV